MVFKALAAFANNCIASLANVPANLGYAITEFLFSLVGSLCASALLKRLSDIMQSQSVVFTVSISVLPFSILRTIKR